MIRLEELRKIEDEVLSKDLKNQEEEKKHKEKEREGIYLNVVNNLKNNLVNAANKREGGLDVFKVSAYDDNFPGLGCGIKANYCCAWRDKVVTPDMVIKHATGNF